MSTLPSKASERPYGESQFGEPVKAFVLSTGSGFVAEFIEFGASLTSLRVPIDGGLREMVLGCDSLAGYEAQSGSLGAIVGRIANRTDRGRLPIDDVVHQLGINLDCHHLHGGEQGFGRRIWQGELRVDHRGPSVRFVYLSMDGEEGYPGAFEATVDYTLGEDGTLWMEYRGLSDAPTAVNLSNHAYFNLDGEGAEDCLGHRVRLDADRFVETDAQRIPTGRLPSVEGTPLDLRTSTLISEGIEMSHPLIEQGGQGFDHTLVFSDWNRACNPVGEVMSSDGRIVMSMLTDQPSVQLYTSNFLGGTGGRDGIIYGTYAGFCLEAQHLPDAPNQPGFPSIILRPGQIYSQRTAYRFVIS